MAFQLNRIVPWGRSLNEYRAMFSLTDSDLRKRIVGCADGPAGFNAELTRAGGCVVSFDPIYSFSTEQIKSRIDEVAPEIFAKVKSNRLDFRWNYFASPEDLLLKRRSAMDDFIVDFEKGKEQGRYISADVLKLPFDDDSFELALCSHFLLLYGAQLSLTFHLNALIELLRVSPEVRIFPIIELGNQPSRHLDELRNKFQELGCSFCIQEVDYEFQIGGNQMAVVRRASELS